MITLSYACRDCEFTSALLDDAQSHANTQSHHLTINGTLTPNSRRVSESSVRNSNGVALREHRENEILRRAREKGLLRK